MSNWAKLQEQLMGKPVAKRAKHGIHFQNNDGSITANFSGKPCHFQDTDGLWKPIDTKLLPLGDGYYGCPHSKVKVKPDGTVAVAGTNYVQYTQLPSGQTGLVDNDKLVRKFSFGEQRMWVTEDGFHSEIQLNRIPTLTEARKLIATESGTLSKDYLKSLTTATDANGNAHTYSTLSAFRTWLASASYPVVIDPDFTAGAGDGYIQGYNTVWATARSTSHAYISNSNIIVSRRFSNPNYWCYRSVIPFDTSTIGAGSTVTQVNLKLCGFGTQTPPSDVQIVEYDFSSLTLTNATDRETCFDGILAGGLAATFVPAGTGINNTQRTSPNLTTSYVKKTGTTTYGMRSKSDYDNDAAPSTDEKTIFRNSEDSESYRPVLTVTYTAGGSITPIVQYYNRLRRN